MSVERLTGVFGDFPGIRPVYHFTVMVTAQTVQLTVYLVEVRGFEGKLGFVIDRFGVPRRV